MIKRIQSALTIIVKIQNIYGRELYSPRNDTVKEINWKLSHWISRGSFNKNKFYLLPDEWSRRRSRYEAGRLAASCECDDDATARWTRGATFSSTTMTSTSPRRRYRAWNDAITKLDYYTARRMERTCLVILHALARSLTIARAPRWRHHHPNSISETVTSTEVWVSIQEGFVWLHRFSKTD